MKKVNFQSLLSKDILVNSDKAIQAKNYLEKGKYPIVDQGKKKIIGYSDNANYLTKLSSPIIIFGDHTRIFKFIDFDFIIGADGVKLINPDIEQISPKYFYHILNFIKIPDAGYSRHYKYLKNFEIPIPNKYKDQIAIANKLDKQMEQIEKMRQSALKQQEAAKSMEASILREIFPFESGEKLPEGWEWKKLSDIFNFIRGPFGGSLKKNIFVQNGFCVYEQQHIIYNDFNNVRYFITEKKFNEMRRFQIQNGDLIMSCSGTFGKFSISPDDIKPGIINQALLILRPKFEFNTMFVKAYLKSPYFQEKLGISTGGAAIKNVPSVSELKKFKIPIPNSKTIQNNINKNIKNKLIEIYELSEQISTQHGAIQSLPASILRETFKEV